jgi:K+-sensing histidine kinase KdpD
VHHVIDRIQPVFRYVGVVSLIGWAVLVTILVNLFKPSEFSSVEFWVLGTVIILAEFFPIQLPRRTEVVTISAAATFTLALLLTHGLGAALPALVAAGIVDDAWRRKPLWKMGFNAAQYTLSLSAGALLLQALTELPRPEGAFELIELPAIMLAGVVFFMVNSLLTGIGIALAEGGKIAQSLRANVALISVTDALLLAFTPIVVAVVDYSLWLLPLLALPMIAVYKSATISLRNLELARNLEALYDATRLSYGEQKLEDSIRSLLQQTCEMFRAEQASLILLSSDESDHALQSSFVVDGASTFMKPIDLDPRSGVWARVIAEEAALQVARGSVGKKLRAHLEAEEIHDALLAPVRGSDAVIGIMQVANRIQGSFTDDDVKLFETLANHAGVSVENARLVSQLEESLAHLTEMNRLKDDFVASVSHELRTPLTSIKGYVGTLLRSEVNFSEEQKRDFLETVARQSNRLHRLIEDLLAVSRIESATTSATLSTLSLSTLVQDVLDELRDRLEAHPVELRLEPDLPLIETDQGKVHQILGNLVENAMKYSEPGARVTISGRRDREGVLVTVADEGRGIPADQQAKIFDRFYQVDQSSTRAVGGTGLGLYICRTMAEALGARIWLDKSDETGSVFAFWLPVSFWMEPQSPAPITSPSSG